jgi:hypothetical protein
MAFVDNLSIAYILSSSDKEATILSSELETIKALTKNVKTLKVVRATTDVPAGCGSSVLTSDSSIYVDVLVRLVSLDLLNLTSSREIRILTSMQRSRRLKRNWQLLLLTLKS